jgi:iron complex outermembrane recepter protein
MSDFEACGISGAMRDRTASFLRVDYARLAVLFSVLIIAGGSGYSAQADSTDNQLDEIVVTAQKRSENVKDIPISISAINGDEMERLHIQGYEDISRIVPSVSFAAGGGGNSIGEGELNIEIRGVSSISGAATTGLYLDETSITVNQNFGVGAFQPMAVDLKDVEVLRGPQGTLYGASSEGGTIRFIQNQAKLDTVEGYASTDLSGTSHGGLNYMEKGVLNIPVIPGIMALRGNIAYGYDSGWIDHYSLTGTLLNTGVNSVRREMARLGATITPNGDLTITPNLFYQRTEQADTPVFEIQDPAFAAANSFIIPPPVPSDGLYHQHFLVKQPIRDTAFIPSFTVKYGTPFGEFASITSYMRRDMDRVDDGTDFDSFYIANYLQSITPNPKNLSVIGNLPSPSYQPAQFGTISQELRFSTKPFDVLGLPTTAVAGLYYSDQTEVDTTTEPSVGISNAFQSIYGYGINSPESPIGNPSDPTFWANDVTAYWHSTQHTIQNSLFGQADVHVLPDLTASLGARYVIAHVSSTVYSGDHFFNADPTLGGVYFLGYQRNVATTPKFSLKYDVDPDVNVYTTVAKGYRLGGFDPEPPPTGSNSVCEPDYKFLGITAPKDGFGPDHVWSYELGSKMRLLGNSLSIDTAGYYIQWIGIQQEFILPFCGFPYALNVGDARSYGAELQLSYKPDFVPGATFGFNGDYAHATITSSNSPTVVAVGEHVLFVPEYQATFSGEYRRPLSDNLVALLHADYDMTGPSNGSYIMSNPGYINNPYRVLNASVGALIKEWEFNVYAKNLLNDHTLIQTPSLNLQVTGYTVRPLTAGITVTRRF